MSFRVLVGSEEADTKRRGDHPPSYIYRLIKEAYDDEDVEL